MLGFRRLFELSSSSSRHPAPTPQPPTFPHAGGTQGHLGGDTELGSSRHQARGSSDASAPAAGGAEVLFFFESFRHTSPKQGPDVQPRDLPFPKHSNSGEILAPPPGNRLHGEPIATRSFRPLYYYFFSLNLLAPSPSWSCSTRRDRDGAGSRFWPPLWPPAGSQPPCSAAQRDGSLPSASRPCQY